MSVNFGSFILISEVNTTLLAIKKEAKFLPQELAPPVTVTNSDFIRKNTLQTFNYLIKAFYIVSSYRKCNHALATVHCPVLFACVSFI